MKQRSQDYAYKLVIAALKCGEEWAFAEVYNEYFDVIYQYCLHFSKSKVDAEDIAQDAFMRLWISREHIQNAETVKPLLFSTARNLLISRFRKNLATPIFEDYLDYINDLPAQDNNPIEFREFIDNFVRHVDELPEGLRRIVKLSKIEQKSNKEIAEKLGINEQSVKNSVSQGMKILRTKIGRYLLFLLPYLTITLHFIDHNIK